MWGSWEPLRRALGALGEGTEDLGEAASQGRGSGWDLMGQSGKGIILEHVLWQWVMATHICKAL